MSDRNESKSMSNVIVCKDGCVLLHCYGPNSDGGYLLLKNNNERNLCNHNTSKTIRDARIDSREGELEGVLRQFRNPRLLRTRTHREY